MIFLVQLGINKHSQNFFKDHNFVSLWKNLLVLIYSKLHEKSCDYLSKKQKNNKGSPARTGSTKRSTDQGSMFCIHAAISRKVVGKKVHATILKGSMGCDQCTVSDTVAVKPTFAASL